MTAFHSQQASFLGGVTWVNILHMPQAGSPRHADRGPHVISLEDGPGGPSDDSLPRLSWGCFSITLFTLLMGPWGEASCRRQGLWGLLRAASARPTRGSLWLMV